MLYSTLVKQQLGADEVFIRRPTSQTPKKSLPSHLENTFCTLSFALLKPVVDGSRRLPHMIISRTRTLEILHLESLRI